jgi:hypothetical protein
MTLCGPTLSKDIPPARRTSKRADQKTPEVQRSRAAQSGQAALRHERLILRHAYLECPDDHFSRDLLTRNQVHRVSYGLPARSSSSRVNEVRGTRNGSLNTVSHSENRC